MQKIFSYLRLTPTLALILALFFLPLSALALSEYGLRCSDNKDCVKCRNDLKCMKCMSKCWNTYGYADTDIKNSKLNNKEELCQQKRAKWCNAQCWDPDDKKEQDYVSTKPDCSEIRFYMPKGGMQFPPSRPQN